MNSIDLHRIDLNLLVVFQAIMHEGGVTRAAVKLHLSQSAVSATLARLRVLFRDPLFDRTRAGMVPTARAREISAQLGPSLTSIAHLVFESHEFDPTRSTRTMHLAMSDDLEMMLAPWLVQRKIDQGWKTDFGFHQTNSALWRESIDEATHDIVLAADPGKLPSTVRCAPLFSGTYLCLHNRQLTGLSGPLSYDEYVAADHCRVAYDARLGWVDEVLAAVGCKRRVLCSISHFAGLAPILTQTPAVATIPSHAARTLAGLHGLAVSPVPLQAPRFTISALWNARTDGTTENIWLRALLSDFAATF